MTTATTSAIHDHGRMESDQPESRTATRRRAFTEADRIAHLDAYEKARQHGEGGA